jgi:Secretion system C-terminal sorting domain
MTHPSDLYTNGEEIDTDIPSVQAAFDDAITKIGMMTIAASHSFAGHVITVDATILPYSNFPNCHVYIVVMEKITHNNVMTNGETSFEHVMMKIIPDGYGTTLNFTDRVSQSIHQVVDLTGTHVEEWTDLIVGVFVQDYQTREVYQSSYSVENGVFNMEARLSDILVNNVGISGFNPDQMNYTVTLPGGTSVVPDITGIPIDPKEIVIVVPALTLPAASTIDVFAENLTDHNLYTVNFSFAAGQDEQKAGEISMFPNPSSGSIRIYGASHSNITIFTTNGIQVRSFCDFTGTALNLSDLQKGVYILNIQREDNSVVRKKIVLL